MQMLRDPLETAAAPQTKVLVVAPTAALLEEMRLALDPLEGGVDVTTVRGGPDRLAATLEEMAPHVVMVAFDGGNEDLQVLERLTARLTETAFLLLSNNQSVDFLKLAMRSGVRDVLPLPLSPALVREAVGRIQQRIAAQAPRKSRGRVVVFLGSKGGCGTSFLAANLAYATAAAGEDRVALLDFNTQFGDAVLAVSERPPQATLADVMRSIHRLDPALLDSCMVRVLPNFSVLAAPENPEEASDIRGEQIDALLWVVAAQYDVVFVDAGRLLDDVSLRALDRADEIHLVVQLSIPYVRHAQRLLQALGGLGFARDKVRVLVNRQEKSAAISVEELKQTLKHDVSRVIPNSFAAAVASVDQGTSIIKLAPRDPVARALREMAADYATAPAAAKTAGGLLRGLLARR